jgi:hypothetical protein
MHGQSISLLPEEQDTCFRFTLARSRQEPKKPEA